MVSKKEQAIPYPREVAEGNNVISKKEQAGN